MTDPRPLRTFCWCELATADAAGAKAFYAALFGWSFADEDMGAMGTYTRILLDGGDLGGLFELTGPMFAGVPPHWMFHVSTPDVDASAATAVDLGGRVVLPPLDVPGAGRMAVIEDPTGAKLALWQAREHLGTTLDPMTPNAFGWVELQTRDVASARAFYRALFGWEAKASAGSMPYTEWQLPGGPPFAGMIQIDERWGDAPSNWLGYVMVDDCDATFAEACQLGATPYVPPQDIEKVGRFAVIADPQGAVFAFIQMLPMAI
jgi:predicted enzyme related to lactoylglutathione lyase